MTPQQALDFLLQMVLNSPFTNPQHMQARQAHQLVTNHMAMSVKKVESKKEEKPAKKEK